MKFSDILRGCSPVSEDRKKKVWDEGIVCLDTNILLDLYRFEKSREDFFVVLDKIKDRLFVPHRVAVEFARNRPAIIRNHFEPNILIRHKLDELAKALREKHRHHGDIDELLKTVEKMREVERATFKEREEKHISLLDEDPHLDRLLKIVNDRIGPPAPEEELAKDYDRRKATRTPPFCPTDDGKKDDVDEQYGDDERRGDVAIWLEVLAFCEQEKKPLIFVTRDGKPNWWVPGGKGKFPQPSLAQEFFSRVGSDVLFYDFGSFYEATTVRLSVKRSESLVKESKEIDAWARSQRRSLGGFPSIATPVAAARLSALAADLTRHSEGLANIAKFSEHLKGLDSLKGLVNFSEVSEASKAAANLVAAINRTHAPHGLAQHLQDEIARYNELVAPTAALMADLHAKYGSLPNLRESETSDDDDSDNEEAVAEESEQESDGDSPETEG